MRKNAWIVLAHLIAVAVLVAANQAAAFELPDKPNIIYIMTDDLGYGDLGSYGQTRIKTPHLDQLAAEGMRFTDAYSGSTVCAPSRCVWMTGFHTGHAEVRGNREVKPMGQHPLADETVTAAEILKSAGYRTGLFGKWGLGGPGSVGAPNKQGFDEFFGYLGQRHAHNFYPEFLFKNEKRVPLEGNVMPEPKRADGAGMAIKKVTYSHDVITAEAFKFVEVNKDGPFFVALTWTIPHANNEAGRKGMEVPDLGEYANKDWPEPEIGKAAMITHMDRDVGKLKAKLKELGIDKKTLIIFTSDNGPHAEGGVNPKFHNSSGPLRGYKRSLTEGGIRVPMIAYWPGVIEAGTVNRTPNAFWDFLPTVADLAGAGDAVPQNIDGISIAAAFEGETVQPNRVLYWEFGRGNGFQQAVRRGKWKLIRRGGKTIELYDLSNDLGEANNIAADHVDIVEELTKAIDANHTPHPLWPTLPE